MLCSRGVELGGWYRMNSHAVLLNRAAMDQAKVLFGGLSRLVWSMATSCGCS
jgi:hypothetical protein